MQGASKAIYARLYTNSVYFEVIQLIKKKTFHYIGIILSDC